MLLRTYALYEGILRLHILPTLGPAVLSDLKPPLIRTWHAGLLSGSRQGASTAAKSYRLLRSILATAVDDEVLEKNSCRVRGAGVDELHFHDLRHTGATLAATTGATTRELMARMGHASPRAALIYQHATQERDQAIARAAPQESARVIALRESRS